MKTALAVIGKWASILPMLGVDAELLTGKHVDCPLCNRKKDFRFDDNEGKGTWICVCSRGNGWSLLEELNGWNFPTAAAEVDKVIGNASSTPIVKNDDSKKRKDRLNKLFKRTVAMEHSDHVIEYLKQRGLSVKTLSQVTGRLRYAADLEYYEQDQPTQYYDAMVAMVTQNGKPITLHTTYIFEGDKAQVGAPRKILPTLDKLAGAACELYPFTDELGVAEGIETALSAFQLFGVPTWACINSGNMESFKVPDGVKTFHIFSDADSGYTGQAAAFSLAKKTTESARRIKRKLKVIVHLPNLIEGRKGNDWNDVVQDA
jgi:putative DNA primase/helicase